jgi:hypothetical protein
MATKDAPKPVDRVVMASRAPDGTPVQSEGFEFIGDKEFVQAAATEQLSQIAVSADDAARAQEQAAETAAAGTSLSPEEEERIKRHKELQEAAAKQAAAEVNEKHTGPDTSGAALQRSAPLETTATRSAAKKTG